MRRAAEIGNATGITLKKGCAVTASAPTKNRESHDPRLNTINMKKTHDKISNKISL